MALAKASNGMYHRLTGATVSELLGGLSDERVEPKDIVNVADDGLSAVYRKGNPSI